MVVEHPQSVPRSDRYQPDKQPVSSSGSAVCTIWQQPPLEPSYRLFRRCEALQPLSQVLSQACIQRKCHPPFEKSWTHSTQHQSQHFRSA